MTRIGFLLDKYEEIRQMKADLASQEKTLKEDIRYIMARQNAMTASFKTPTGNAKVTISSQIRETVTKEGKEELKWYIKHQLKGDEDDYKRYIKTTESESIRITRGSRDD
jgi:hypothetical protein